MRCIFIFLCLIVAPGAVYGHGFANYVQGAKAFSMGGAFSAVADDSSAIYFNPAGLQQLDKNQIMIGFSHFFPADGRFTSSGTSNIPGSGPGQSTSINGEHTIIPYLYSSFRPNKKINLGIGVYTPFGQSTQWPALWEGRFLGGGLKAGIESFRLESVAAFSLTSRINLSLGAFVQRVDIEMQQKNWLPGEFGTTIKGDDLQPGFSAGLLIRLTDHLNFGLSYKSRVNHEIRGISVDVEPEIPAMGIADAGAHMAFTTPAMMFTGLAYTWGKWTFSADLFWTEWSVQDRISIQTNSPLMGDVTLVKNWDDALTYGFGANYRFSDAIDLSLGYIIDKSPIPSAYLDAMVIHEDSQVFCLGANYHHPPYTVSLAFGHIQSNDRYFNNGAGDSPNPGGGRVTGYFNGNSQNVLSLSMACDF